MGCTVETRLEAIVFSCDNTKFNNWETLKHNNYITSDHLFDILILLKTGITLFLVNTTASDYYDQK